jgi:hypothetical protein
LVEGEIQEWVSEFIAEVDRIEAFYQKNFKELKAEFHKLEKQYNRLDTEDDSLTRKFTAQRKDTRFSIQADHLD